LSVYEKRDKYLMVLQELFNERDRLNEDIELTINDVNQSTLTSTLSSTIPLQPHHPLLSPHRGGKPPPQL
jgi:hypothetical protein